MLDARASSLAPELLPNGRREGPFWCTSNVSDVKTGSYSLKVNLTGNVGLWTDFGAARSAPDRGGDMLKLVALNKFGGDIGEALKWARSWLGLDNLDPGRLATERARVSRIQKRQEEEARAKAEKMRRLAQALFIDPRAVPIPGTPAEAYLSGRGIDLRRLGRAPRALKYHPAVFNKEAGQELPCLIARVQDMAGNHVATHRTWIKPDGSGKADLENAKMCLASFMGGYIPLWKGHSQEPLHRALAGKPVGMSEGIEDGLTVACFKPELRVIAAVTLGNMAAIELPDTSAGLIIIGQRDKPGSQAERALGSAIAFQQARGHEVRLALPPEGVKDFNDFARGCLGDSPDAKSLAEQAELAGAA